MRATVEPHKPERCEDCARIIIVVDAQEIPPSETVPFLTAITGPNRKFVPPTRPAFSPSPAGEAERYSEYLIGDPSRGKIIPASPAPTSVSGTEGEELKRGRDFFSLWDQGKKPEIEWALAPENRWRVFYLVKDLADALAASQEEKEQWRKDCHEAEFRWGEADRMYSERLKEIAASQEEIEIARTEARSNYDCWQNAEDTVKILSSELSSYRGEKEMLTEALAECRAEVERLHEARWQLEAVCEDQKTEIERLKKTSKRARYYRNKSGRDQHEGIEVLRQRIALLEQEREGLREALEKIDNEYRNKLHEVGAHMLLRPSEIARAALAAKPDTQGEG
jgi:prefoldin subunit 5